MGIVLERGKCVFGVHISGFDFTVLRLIQQERKKRNENGPRSIADEGITK